MDKEVAIARLSYLKMTIKKMGRFKGRAAIIKDLNHYIFFLETHADDQEQNKIFVDLGEQLLTQAWIAVEPHKAHEYQTN
jgi:hypothetical protein